MTPISLVAVGHSGFPAFHSNSNPLPREHFPAHVPGSTPGKGEAGCCGALCVCTGAKGKVAIIPASALVADSVSLYMQHSRSARAIGLFSALRDEVFSGNCSFAAA